jgi:transposase
VSIPEGFNKNKYDDELYFHDGGVIGNKRFIIGFNPPLFTEDRTNRDEKISFFKSFLKKENNNLNNAKRDREFDATKSRIINELRRLKIQKYYKSPELEPITVQDKLKSGAVKSIKSFKVEIEMKNDVIKAEKLLDGVCVFVTNHTAKQGRGFKMKPQRIIKAYREKTKIEDVFKNVKSFLKIRPFFVNTDSHVKAVYTVCIVSYFINKYLSNKRKAIGDQSKGPVSVYEWDFGDGGTSDEPDPEHTY